MGQSAWNGTCPLHDQAKNKSVNCEKNSEHKLKFLAYS